MRQEGEPEWLDEDTSLVLAYLQLEAEMCDGCGLPFSETMDPENDRQYESKPMVCHACAARGMASEIFNESADEYSKAGAKFTIEKPN